MYNFDLRTPESAYDFLLTFFNMSGQDIMRPQEPIIYDITVST